MARPRRLCWKQRVWGSMYHSCLRDTVEETESNPVNRYRLSQKRIRSIRALRMDFPMYIDSSLSFPLLLFFLLLHPTRQFHLCRKLISSVCFANQLLWGFFSALFPEGCFNILLPTKRVNVQSTHETLLFNKPGLGHPVQPAHSSTHSRLGVMKICIYIVPCTWHWNRSRRVSAVPKGNMRPRFNELMNRMERFALIINLPCLRATCCASRFVLHITVCYNLMTAWDLGCRRAAFGSRRLQ